MQQPKAKQKFKDNPADKTKDKPRDSQHYKYQITINNPLKHGFDRKTLKSKLGTLVSAEYWCIVDEIGGKEGTPHCHIFIKFSSGMRFSTLKKLFNDTAHIEIARGSCKQNVDYLRKTGKWADTEKSETIVEGSFESWGEMPQDRPTGFSIEAAILTMLEEGASNAEILRKFPESLKDLRNIEYARQILRSDEHRVKWRTLCNTYIYGPTGVGKTRSVMDGCGYSNVYAVNDYTHPFDGYAGESVMLFDEFSSGIKIQDMLRYMDGYPISLPARYSNRQACFETIFIISNIDIRDQYSNVQINQPEVWKAFLRRIHKVIRFNADGTREEYDTADYMNYDIFSEIKDNVDISDTPFGDQKGKEQANIVAIQTKLTEKLNEAAISSDVPTAVNADDDLLPI